MFEHEAVADPAGFLAGVAGQLTKLPRHWTDGGPTALSNLGLLCAGHPPPRSAGGTPTYVHQHDLSATITDTAVTWQTNPPQPQSPWSAAA